MSTQSFQLDPSLANLPPALLKKRYDQMTPEERQAAGFTRPATDAEIAAAQTPTGAPANFGGAVLPNPNGVKVSADTDSGIEPTRLPNGVSFQQQNFHGATPGDTSNPPHTQMSTTSAQFGPDTTAAKSSGTAPVFGPDGTLGDIPQERLADAVKAGAKPGVNIIAPDGSKGVVPADRYVEAAQAGAKIAPFEDQDVKHPGFWASLGNDLKAMIPSGNANTNDASWQGGRVGAAEHQGVIDNAQQAAADQWRKESGYSGTYRAAAPIAEGLGVNVKGMEQSAQEGDVGGVAGHAAAVPTAMAATEGLARGVPAVITSDTGASIIRNTAKVANKALEKAPGTIGTAAGAAIGAASKVPYGAEVGAGLGSVIGKEVLPQIKLPGEHFGLPDTVEGGPRTIVQDPETGKPEFSDVVAAKQNATQATPAAPAATPAKVEQALNESLGGQPLVRGVSLRNQPAAQAAAAGKLPAGFTPVDSTVLKGYKYDPQAQEFTAITNNGQSYTHGEVTPEQVAAFENADSQGSAWTKFIRNNNVLVKKNGVPVTPGTMGSESGNIMPKSRSGMNEPETETYSQPLQQMLDEALQDKNTAPTGKSGSILNRLVKGEAGQAGSPGSVTDADEGIADIQSRPVLATKTGQVPARGYLNMVGADENSVLKTPADLDSVFYHRQQIAQNGTPNVELHVDEAGNIIGAQGRHRAIAAIQQGGPSSKVNVTIYKHPFQASE